MQSYEEMHSRRWHGVLLIKGDRIIKYQKHSTQDMRSTDCIRCLNVLFSCMITNGLCWPFSLKPSYKKKENFMYFHQANKQYSSSVEYQLTLEVAEDIAFSYEMTNIK